MLSLSGSVRFRAETTNRLRLDVQLTINPTRTLAHAWAKAGENWGSLSPVEFFQPEYETNVPRSLDGNDNFLNFVVGPYEPLRELNNRLWAEGWNLYRLNLTALLGEMFIPPELADGEGLSPTQCAVGQSIIDVDLDVERLVLNYVEAYFERSVGDAPVYLRSLAPLVRRAARNTSARTYFTDMYLEDGIREESPSLRIPQRNEVDLVVYAKDRARIRYEFRLRSPSHVIGAPEHGPDKLERYASSAIRFAQNRTNEPFEAIISLMAEESSAVGVERRAARLAEAVRAACKATDREANFELIFETLLIHQEVTSTFINDLSGDNVLLNRLVRDDVLKHRRFNRYEASAGRRYALARRFQLE
ncbi:hypothetical protein [Oceanicaulis sp.]|uniref:hypothetical protein n=1 Tax=Oceanicaulis sp. TaxID=1924941 RepID=UPI003D281036